MSKTFERARLEAHLYPNECWFCVHKCPHPSYVYLMTDSREESDLVPYVGISRSPFMRLKCHRREPGVVVGHKSTNKGKKYWRMELVIGPFEKLGKQFKENWRHHSRKLINRLLRGYWMAGIKEKIVYARDREWLLRVIKNKKLK